MMAGARRADFCVGYFNLRGWGKIAENVSQLRGENGDFCRLLIGMTAPAKNTVRNHYSGMKPQTTQQNVHEARKAAIDSFAKQLTLGNPTAEDEENLQRLMTQLETGKTQVRFYGRRPLHAKLYMIHREDNVAAVAGVVGSSNLTLAGLEDNYELNVDVLDQDTARKLAEWFEERWNDDWSPDIGEDIVRVIKQSWADGPKSPYHVYVKTAFELSRDAVGGTDEYPLPREFRGELLEFQAQAAAVAAKTLHRQGGVVIGDVVGLGKTITAAAVAKMCQMDGAGNVLIVCPPKLEKMWMDYLHKYQIAGDILSHGKTGEMAEMRRHRIIIVDESHNFRNRNSARYSHLADYIRTNESRVILLTATPYNKEFRDIAAQLRLFVSGDADIGIRPDAYIKNLGGATTFQARHPQTPINSLAAFEHSEYVDDWRELMRRYMIRRTRGYIQKHYAKCDEDQKRYFLTFANGQKFYFPKRVPRRMEFGGDANADDYDKLYSDKVVETIGELSLPRYGMQKYINDIPPAKEDEQTIKNLTRAGGRLRGFTRSMLFKRLESGGDAFLLSVKRHILRNAVYLAALDAQGELPIGQIDADATDRAMEEDEMFAGENLENQNDWRQAGGEIYRNLRDTPEQAAKFTWLNARYFLPEFRAALEKDIKHLQNILAIVPRWNAKNDRKLNALDKLLQKTHGNEKVLIFTQFTDTARYLLRELQERKIKKIAIAHGDSDAADIAARFSPRSNNANFPKDELRVLIATDALSEGQNLQDAHIVVNYDLPWALIRLIQRAGRVDRIGQTSAKILCYSALPADGIEKIISLRERLRARMEENAGLVGTDERFFDGDPKTQRKELQSLYTETAILEEEEDETDLLSRALDIWREAVKDDPALAEKIRNLPDVVYSAKTSAAGGVVAYIKSGANDILAHIGEDGEIVSQSQAHILDLLKCDKNEPARPRADNHHEAVKKAATLTENNAAQAGGQLGGRKSVRRKLYDRLRAMTESPDAAGLFPMREVRTAMDAVYQNPLTEIARDRFRRLFQNGAPDSTIRDIATQLHSDRALCVFVQESEKLPKIICSMGLRK